MKLYFSPGACSLAPHIALRESGQDVELVKVDLAKKQTQHGEDYLKINPKGYVPALKLDDGQVFTEAAAVLQYIADRKPASKLAPAAGTLERYRLIEWLTFISSEIHKTLGALYNRNITPEWKDNQLSIFARRADALVEQLEGKRFLMGDQFTIADAYLFTVLSWSGHLKVDLGKWPALREYLARVNARAAVKDAMRAEGLIK